MLDNNGKMYIVTDHFEIDSDVSLAEQLGVSLSYFPNPATNQLTVECKENRTLKLEIMDLQGRLLESKKLKSTETSTQFEVSGLAEGTYLLRITENGEVLTTKKWVKK